MSNINSSRWCKICGITRVEDARVVAEAGAQAYGLVFYEPSPRALRVEIAAKIAREVHSISRVGLFVDPSAKEVETILDSVELDMLQFHGDEAPEFCARFSLPYLKAIRMRPEIDMGRVEDHYENAWGLLLDTYLPGVAGGTGQQFDLALWPQRSAARLILAGGLNADNVADSIRASDPYGVDVSGGVEVRKGVKSHAMIRRFVKQAHNVPIQEA
jgi:phosphoribosylanthranilate isomerase